MEKIIRAQTEFYFEKQENFLTYSTIRQGKLAKRFDRAYLKFKDQFENILQVLELEEWTEFEGLYDVFHIIKHCKEKTALKIKKLTDKEQLITILKKFSWDMLYQKKVKNNNILFQSKEDILVRVTVNQGTATIIDNQANYFFNQDFYNPLRQGISLKAFLNCDLLKENPKLRKKVLNTARTRMCYLDLMPSKHGGYHYFLCTSDTTNYRILTLSIMADRLDLVELIVNNGGSIKRSDIIWGLRYCSENTLRYFCQKQGVTFKPQKTFYGIIIRKSDANRVSKDNTKFKDFVIDNTKRLRWA